MVFQVKQSDLFLVHCFKQIPNKMVGQMQLMGGLVGLSGSIRTCNGKILKNSDANHRLRYKLPQFGVLSKILIKSVKCLI